MEELTEREIKKKYKDLSVLMLEPHSISGLGEVSIERLKLAELRLTKRGHDESLPYYVAFQHHIEGTPLSILAKELDIPYGAFMKVFDHYGIPKLKKSKAMEEARKRKKWSSRKNDVQASSQDIGDKEKVRKAYDEIASRRDPKGWENTIPEIADETKLSEEVVGICLEELVHFRIKKPKKFT